MRTVRSSVTALALLLAMAATSSAQSLEEKLEEKLKEKLKEPFVSNAPWVLDYADALTQAKAGNKIIFAYFTRSYSP